MQSTKGPAWPESLLSAARKERAASRGPAVAVQRLQQRMVYKHGERGKEFLAATLVLREGYLRAGGGTF